MKKNENKIILERLRQKCEPKDLIIIWDRHWKTKEIIARWIKLVKKIKLCKCCSDVSPEGRFPIITGTTYFWNSHEQRFQYLYHNPLHFPKTKDSLDIEVYKKDANTKDLRELKNRINILYKII